MAHIERIDIQNWRSIRSLTIEPKPLCALIGPNNAGKSNILAALEVVFGTRYPTEGSFREEDRCFGERDLLPEICVQWRDDAGETADFSFHKGIDDPTLAMHRGNSLGRWSRGVPRDEWERFSVLHIGTDRQVSQQAPTNRWSLLGRMLQEVDRALNDARDQRAAFDEALETLQEDVLRAAPGFDELRTTLQSTIRDQLGGGISEVDVDLSIRDPWSFYRLLHLIYQEHGVWMRADQAGAGLQSALVLGIVRAYGAIAHRNRAVICIEEPELFLHPQAVRRLYRLLRGLAYPADGGPGLQILYTTHSAAMLDLAHFDEVVMVRKGFRGDHVSTTVLQVEAPSVVRRLRESAPNSTEESLRARLTAWVDPRRSEALFAAAVLLVEGPTEALCLPIFAEALEIDLEGLNIAVLPVGGKALLSDVRTVLTDFEIPCFVVADADGDCREEDREHNRRMNRVLIDQAGADIDDFPPNSVDESLALWRTDFEGMLSSEAGRYQELAADASSELGVKSKSPAAAAWACSRLAVDGHVPSSVHAILLTVAAMAGAREAA